MGKIGNSLYLLLVFTIAAGSNALAGVNVNVSPNPATTEDSVLLRIEVDATEGNISRPTFTAPNFDVVGQSSSRQTFSQYVNGKFTLSGKHTFSFVLYPKAAGRQTISNIKVKVGDKEESGDDVIVQVRQGNGNSQQSTPQQDETEEEDLFTPPQPDPSPNAGSNSSKVPSELNSDFTVFLSLDKKSAYVGEPIIAEYWLYDYGNMVQMEIKKFPSFNGFWKEDLEVVNQTRFEPFYQGNRRMRRAMLGRYALYGIKPGKISLEKLVVNGIFVTRSRGSDDDPFPFQFFGMGEQRKASHANQETELTILPLPEAGRPANFGGAVGSFTASLSADKQALDVNTPLNLQISFEGIGNFPAIEDPKLNLPAEFEVYESTVNFKDSVPHGMRRPIANKKTFNSVVIPRKPGSYVIPGLEFSYFDPSKKSYQKIKTNDIKVEVTGSVMASTGSGMSGGNTPAAEKSGKDDLFSLKDPENLVLKNAKKYLGLLGILALLVYCLTLLRKVLKKFKTKKATSESTQLKEAAKKLAVAKVDDEFYQAAEEYLETIANLALGRNTKGMLQEEIEAEWRETGLTKESFDNYRRLVDRCASLRYGGGLEKNVSARELLTRELKETSSQVEKHLSKKRKFF